MNYNTGQCFEVELNSQKKTHNWRQRAYKAFIKLGRKYPPKTGKGDRYEVIVIKGEWPYNSISINNLAKHGRLAEAAEVLYGK